MIHYIRQTQKIGIKNVIIGPEKWCSGPEDLPLFQRAQVKSLAPTLAADNCLELQLQGIGYSSGIFRHPLHMEYTHIVADTFTLNK